LYPGQIVAGFYAGNWKDGVSVIPYRVGGSMGPEALGTYEIWRDGARDVENVPFVNVVKALLDVAGELEECECN
jgi:hypothetical protein